MRWTALLFLFGLGMPGCNIAYYASHNLVHEPKRLESEHHFRSRTRHLAKTIWEKEIKPTIRCDDALAFRDGFIDGYTDYVVDGGVPHTPAVPPPEYRRHHNDFSVKGQSRQSQYLAGFFQGGSTAAARGTRNPSLVTVALPPTPASPPLTINAIDATSPTIGGQPAPPPPTTTGSRTPGKRREPELYQASATAPIDPAIPPAPMPILSPSALRERAKNQPTMSGNTEPQPASTSTLWGRVPFSTYAQVPAVSFWGGRK